MSDHGPPGATPDVGQACLRANLAAIAERDALLRDRIALPVASDHVRLGADGVRYRHRGAWHDLGLTRDAIDEALDGVAAEPDALFLFGVGVGELVVAAARRWQAAAITVWERDPWLLRLFLMQVDCADVIRAGRLRFALVGDILDHAGNVADDQLVVHPLLGRVYRDELRVLREGAGPRRALVCAGDLFVDDVTEALVDQGFTPLTLDTALLSVEEMGLLVRRVRPRVVVAVNYKGGLAEFCRAADVPLATWEIDPNTDGVAAVDGPCERAHVFTYRAAQVDLFRRAGFSSVAYLPLAANPRRRRPLDLDAADRERFAADVSFVGASMADPARRYRERFVAIVAAGEDGDDAAARAAVERRLDEVLAAQAEDDTSWRIPALLAAAFPDLRAAWVASGSQEDPVMLVGEIAAAARRRAYVTALAPLGVHVWGDEGWAGIGAADGGEGEGGTGARYRGAAGHVYELSKVYVASRVNVDIGRLYQSDIVPMRVFDVLACGAFVLAEHSAALAELFTVGIDVESYRTRDELVDKARWYLAHPTAAAAIAARGMERVRADHTIAARVAEMLAVAGVAPA